MIYETENPIPPPKTTSYVQPDSFWGTVGRLSDALNLSSSDIADLMGIPYPRFLEIRAKRQLPYAVHLEFLARAIHVSIENLLKGQIDFEAVAAHRTGNASHMPRKYTRAAYSRGNWVAPIIGYLESTRGVQCSTRALRHCQIQPALFKDPEAKTNIHLQADLLDFASLQGVTDDGFQEMGRFAVQVNRGSMMHGLLSRLATARCVYETAIGDLGSLFDENWDYSLERIEDGVARVTAAPRAHVTQALGTDRIGSRRLCQYKAGIGAALLEYRGLPSARARKLKCVHDGDPHCEFEFNFQEAEWFHRLQLKRQSSQRHPV